VPPDAYILLFAVVLIYSKHKFSYRISIDMPRTRRFSHDQQVAWRRQRVLTWIATGKQPYEIANELQVSEMTIKRDLAFLQSLAKQEFKEWVDQKMVWEYTKGLVLLDHIKMQSLKIADESTDDRNKLTALRLAADTEMYKDKLLSGGPTILMAQEIDDKLKRIESERRELEQERELQIKKEKGGYDSQAIFS